VDVLDQIRAAVLEVEHVAGREIELDPLVVVDVDELDHALAGPDVDPVELERQIRRDLVVCGLVRLCEQHVDRQPVLGPGRGPLVRLGEQHAARVLLPPEQQPRRRGDEEQHEQEDPGGPMDLAGEPQQLRLTLPARVVHRDEDYSGNSAS
jgi:hypothetical protein